MGVRLLAKTSTKLTLTLQALSQRQRQRSTSFNQIRGTIKAECKIIKILL